MLLADVRAVLTSRTRSAALTRPSRVPGAAQRIFADPPPRVIIRPGPRKARAGYITIQDATHPWVIIPWLADAVLPVGFVITTTIGMTANRRPQDLRAGAVIDQTPISGFTETLVRLSAERALSAENARRQRDDYRRTRGLEKIAAQVTPGNESPFTQRPPRTSRPNRKPRLRRPPRIPRPPRTPRKPGTAKTKWGAWCRPIKPECWYSQGPCVAWPIGGESGIATPPGPCRGSIIPSCEGCISQGCTSANSWLLSPILKLLPKVWEEKPATPIVERRSTGRMLGPLARRYRELERTQGAGQVPGAILKVDPRAQVAGCSCQDWPGWVICPDCGGSQKCRCVGACIAFDASTGNCRAR